MGYTGVKMSRVKKPVLLTSHLLVYVKVIHMMNYKDRLLYVLKKHLIVRVFYNIPFLMG